MDTIAGNPRKEDQAKIFEVANFWVSCCTGM